MPDSQSIAWHNNNGIVTVTLSQRPLNEIGIPFLESLESLLCDLKRESFHALILHSGLDNGFCAGADLRSLYQGLESIDSDHAQSQLTDFINRIHRAFDALDLLDAVTISVIHGTCFGGGFELMLTTDLRIAENSARFCFPELRLGLIPGFGGIPRLERDVPSGLIRDLIFSGRSINAKKALDVGLVQQVVGQGQGLHVASLLAKQVGKFDETARRSAKKFIKTLPRTRLDEEKALFLKLIQRENVRDSLRTFIEDASAHPYLPK